MNEQKQVHKWFLYSITAFYLLFSAQLIEHVLDLQLPVLLQGVEGLLRHLLLHLLLQGRQLGQDGAEIGSVVGVLVPAPYPTHSTQSDTRVPMQHLRYRVITATLSAARADKRLITNKADHSRVDCVSSGIGFI